MSELTEAQKLICKRAAKLANRRVRDELLAETGEYSLVRRLSQVKGTSIAVLRSSWNPLKADMTGPSGFGYKLKVEADSLTMMILKDTGVYDRVVELGIAAMTETMVGNNKTFVSAILNDLFADAPEIQTAAPESKQSVAPVQEPRRPPRPGMKRKASVAT